MPNLHRGYLAAIAVLLLVPAIAAQRPVRPAGLTDATHGRDAAADYTRLFALDRVHEIRITRDRDHPRGASRHRPSSPDATHVGP